MEEECSFLGCPGGGSRVALVEVAFVRGDVDCGHLLECGACGGGLCARGS